MSTNARALLTEDGAFDGVECVTRDVSRIREAEQSLIHKNIDLQMAQRTANVGSWSFDPEVGVPVWSEEVYRIYQRNPQLGPYALADYQKVYEGESWKTFTSSITRAINEGKPYDIVLKLHFPAGKMKWIHAICEPEPERGPQGHRLRGTIQDISASKQHEELLRQQEYVLTDQTMPDMSGATLALELMKIRDDLPVIICRGYSDSMNEDGARNLGVRALLAKPFEVALLARVVREVLAGPKLNSKDRKTGDG